MMEAETEQGGRVEVLAVVVLYRMSPDESPAFKSLRAAVSESLAGRISCVVYDNSPEAHPLPATRFACSYHHDSSNPGLAAAYQYALEQAGQEHIPWLLLLDQDTIVTGEYLDEALQAGAELRMQPEVGAIAPKLVQDGTHLSPHWPHGERSTKKLEDFHGLLEERVKVFNSGCLLRATAVRASGGFPLDFPLDYLDHATFARLRGTGHRTFLLRSALEHELESKWQNIPRTLKKSPRLRGTLTAETRFYRQYGSPRDLLLLALRRFKLAVRMALYGEVRSLIALVRCTF